jgi:hypothetical protein
MSDEKNSSELKNSEDDSKAKFREALEKKKQGSGLNTLKNQGSQKISGRQSAGNSPKMFRRKSGSA